MFPAFIKPFHFAARHTHTHPMGVYFAIFLQRISLSNVLGENEKCQPNFFLENRVKFPSFHFIIFIYDIFTIDIYIHNNKMTHESSLSNRTFTVLKMISLLSVKN